MDVLSKLSVMFKEDQGIDYKLEISRHEKDEAENCIFVYLWPIPQKERELNPNLTQNLNR